MKGKFLVSSKKIAFTLAEVLITLGIIGVVAAMTLPAVITKYQKKATAQKLKKFYSVMSQAIKLSEIENGPYPDWAPVSSGYMPVDDMINWYNTYLDKYITAIDKRKLDDIHYQVAFKDGSGMNFYFVGENAQRIYIFYCTNYKHCGLEKYDGRTTFLFVLSKHGRNGRYFGTDSILNNPIPTRESLYNACKYATEGHRHRCAALIEADGWEIKDDYPWYPEANPQN